MLEELLQNFPGTVLVISHDRRFIDEFATETWVFEGEGHIETIVGGWKDVEAYYKRIGKNVAQVIANKTKDADSQSKSEPKADSKSEQNSDSTSSAKSDNKKSDKLSFTEAHELELLPEKIESKELELEAVDAQIADPALYSKSADEIKAVNQKRTQVQEELDALYERFELLLSKSEG